MDTEEPPATDPGDENPDLLVGEPVPEEDLGLGDLPEDDDLDWVTDDEEGFEPLDDDDLREED